MELPGKSEVERRKNHAARNGFLRYSSATGEHLNGEEGVVDGVAL
jgi:hypothetical protein